MPLLTQDEIDALGMTPAPEDVPTQNIRLALQGGLLQGADELEAAVMNPLSATGLLGTGPEEYDEYVADVRQKLAAAKKAYPVRSAAAELAGGLAPTVALMGLPGGQAAAAANASRMAALANRVGRPLVGGALGGLGYELGGREGTVSERLEDVGGLAGAAGLGAAGAVVGGEALKLAGGGLSKLADLASKKFGGKASNAVIQEFQDIANNAGIDIDDAIERVANGEILADLSPNAQATLRSYKTSISDESVRRLAERPAELREKAIKSIQGTLTGDADENVINQFKKGVKANKDEASAAYDKIFASAGELDPRIVSELEDIVSLAPEAVKPINDLLKFKKLPALFSVSKDGVVSSNRAPSLLEVEQVRRILGGKAKSANIEGPIRAEYKALEKRLRAQLDDMSPELKDTRAKWASIEQGSELFESGQKVFGKSSDDIEMAFEEASSKGGEALSAFRAGLMDAIRRKKETGRATTLPRVLTDMEKKEAKIFRTIFPGDTYEKTFAMLDRAARSQETKNKVLGGSDTMESLTRYAQQGKGGVLQNTVDVAGAKVGSPAAAARLLSRAVNALGEKLTAQQKRQVAQLLMEENPDVVRRALQDTGGFVELVKAAERASRGLTRVGQVGGVQQTTRDSE